MSISIPTITKNIKIDFNNTVINLNNPNQDYNTVYDYEGYGDFYSCTINLDKKEVLLLLKIDDNVIFEFDLEQYSNTINNAGIDFGIVPIAYDFDQKLLNINFGNPIHYNSRILICAKSNDNRAKKIDGVVVLLTKDN